MTADGAWEPLARLREEIRRCPYHDFLRLEAISADSDRQLVVVRMLNRPEFRLTPDGDAVHGGVLAARADIEVRDERDQAVVGRGTFSTCPAPTRRP